MKGLARDEEEFFAAIERWRGKSVDSSARGCKPLPLGSGGASPSHATKTFEPLPLPKIERGMLLNVIA